MKLKITKEIRSTLNHIAANRRYLGIHQLGLLVNAMLRESNVKDENSFVIETKVFNESKIKENK